MNMKKGLFLLVLSILMLSCESKSKSNQEYNAHTKSSYTEERDQNELPSKEESQEVEEPSKSVDVSSSAPRKSSSYGSSSSSNNEEYDNMRGFDPASEDDSHDNGMSRYMENNDEEGWD